MPDSGKVDVIIFGATAFTGKCVVREFISLNENKYSWAIAGRNENKLREVLEWASVKSGHDVTKIPIIICSCEDAASLNKMARRGRVIINCCGPYRLYGEPVVKACIENGTHHVDVTAEPEYMESIQLYYHKAAEKNGSYIISACAFESVCCDLGVIHVVNNFPGEVNSVESFLKVRGVWNAEPAGNIGTWQSIVYAVANEQNMIRIRKRLHSSLNEPKLEPRLKSRFVVHRCELFNKKFAVPLPEPDQSVVFRTQMFLRNYYKQRPVQYKAYFVCPSLIFIIGFFLMGFFLYVFCKFDFGRHLLLKYPEFFSFGIFSSKGPSEEAIVKSSVCFKFIVRGWTKEIASKFENKEEINVPTNKVLVAEMYCKNFGYGFTSKAAVNGAFTILKESDKMPSRGGVYTPGGAFSRTSYFDQLLKDGASFKILRET
ncbi:saccharopine dehydrogenase-like oxidoreductase [Planococcus citri]|uniref:saccharopine dehydrogenase-like oxidoreductase n=1 Tax=Planococcus citri TaxID=170843 RepID=UPI0031F8E296